MTNNQHGQVPEALIDLIDAYAETRHRCGGVYNAKTEAARKAVIEDLREALGGVQALSAGPMVTSEQRRLIGVIADKIEDGTLFQSGIYPKKDLARFVRHMLDTTPTAPAASPTPPAEQPTPNTGHAEADRLIGRLMSSDPDFEDCWHAAVLIQREIKGPDGFGTWREAAIAERLARVNQQAAPKAAPVTQQAGYAEVIECGNSYAKVKLKGEAFGSTKVGDIFYTAPPVEQLATTTEGYVQPMPDKCDQNTWRGPYYHLPLSEQAAPKTAPGEQNTVPAEWLEQAYREGWAACRDAETIGEEAEDWAFGNSTANSRMIDAQQAAPKQEAPKAAPVELHDHQILAITTAYEQGVGKGRQAHESGKEIANPYDTGYRCDLAWQYGYEEGKEQAERIANAAPSTEQQAAPEAAPGEQNTVPAEWLEQAYREGWAACRDAETIGEEAEDWAFGNSTANSRMIDAQQAAPQQAVAGGAVANDIHGALTAAAIYLTNAQRQYGKEMHRQAIASLEKAQRAVAQAADCAKAAPQQEAQEPCQTCIAMARTVMMDQASFDRKPDCYGIRQITNDEGVEEWEDIRTSPDVAREEANDMMATGRGEIYEVVPLWTTPQPATAPLSDDVVKDAARWRWLSEHIGVAWNEGKFTSLVRIVSDKNRAALNASIDRMMTGDWSDAALAAQGGK